MIAIIAASCAAAGASTASPEDATGIANLLNLVGGIAIIGVLARWNQFWRGRPVVLRRIAHDPAFAAEVAARPFTTNKEYLEAARRALRMQDDL